ncbi:unnamed protein product [Staurois parvus]|uniref:Uncharacterized protein n=1 Tax=Staurois parvus TaxID=386267 RepID=A0ABN9F1U0_9NEOB|nr:unnamed protein product [Staurois parvus]
MNFNGTPILVRRLCRRLATSMHCAHQLRGCFCPVASTLS